MQRTAILLGLGLAITLVLAAPASPAVETSTRTPALYKNCTNLNKYPHGVGKLHDVQAQQHALQPRDVSYNRGLDRDKDGIACEKK